MDVLIVGAGAMGTWFANDVADAVNTVAFADVDDDAAASAAEQADGEVATLEGERRFDVVCLAVPMAAITEAVETQAPRGERAVLDVSGVMATPLSAMERVAPDLERASLHPLFAPERAPGSIAVVRDSSGSAIDSLLEALASAGNDVVDTTASEHDRAMETVQAATHAAVLSFALAAESVPAGFETPIYDDLAAIVDHVTDGNPRVYADIQRTFEGADALAAAAERIAGAEDDDLESLYREAASRWRANRGCVE